MTKRFEIDVNQDMLRRMAKAGDARDKDDRLAALNEMITLPHDQLKKMTQETFAAVNDTVADALETEQDAELRQAYVQMLDRIIPHEKGDVFVKAVTTIIKAAHDTTDEKAANYSYMSAAGAVLTAGDAVYGLSRDNWAQIGRAMFDGLDPNHPAQQGQLSLLNEFRDNVDQNETLAEIVAQPELQATVGEKLAAYHEAKEAMIPSLRKGGNAVWNARIQNDLRSLLAA